MKKEFILLLFVFLLVLFYLFADYIKIKERRGCDFHLTLQDSFQKLQGMDTDDWNYIQTKQDFQALEMFEALYEKNKGFQFDPNPIFKIPEKVHLIWIGPRPFPQKSIENVRTWIAYHPDWTFVFWTDRPRPPPCNGMEVRFLEDFEFQFLKGKYDRSQNFVEKASIWRYEILYQEGGVYIDHDVKCYRPFHKLHSGYHFFVGLEMPHAAIDGRVITTGNSIIGAKPSHPVIERTIQKILDMWEENAKKLFTKDPFMELARVSARTLISLTDACEEGLDLLENIDIVFPACYFFPKPGLRGFYSEHLYATVWRDLYETPFEKYLLKSLKNLSEWDEKILRVELLSLVFVCGCFALCFMFNREIKKGLK